MTPDQPFKLRRGTGRLPVLISVPHAGRAYTRALLGAARVPASALGILEDPLVDQLVGDAIAAGAASIVAHAPRAEIDLNRSLDDLDPGMIRAGAPAKILSRRAGAGLGLIPTRLAGHGAIWRQPLARHELVRRVDTIHRPYHDAIAATLASLRDAFGGVVLLDCHSMPPRTASHPGIVFGDRHAASSGEPFVVAAEAACAARGFVSARNDPYAGGEIVARHGSPASGIHAIQIEIDRGLYLAADLRSEGAGFARIAALLASIVMALADAASEPAYALAAE